MTQPPDLLAHLFNAFNPFSALEPGDPFYVDCHAVRGDDDIWRELGRKIELSNQPTCQLYTGHRGVGKTTELLRLRKMLKDKGYRVVYFASEDDVDEEDAQYTDILLACTRHILEDLQDLSDPSPLVNWLKSRWQSLVDLALTEVRFETLAVEQQISQFAKLTASLRLVPSTRQKIREQVDYHSISLLEALNEFIANAIKQLGNSKLVVIADNLDRIVPVPRDEGGTNHDEIFINRSGQLRRLKCHVIYTVPISLVYSHQATALRDNYGEYQVLPMVMVRQKDNGDIESDGLAKIKELISQRIKPFAPELALDTEMFENVETLNQLCLISGGHMREVVQLTQSALNWTDTLPVTASAVRRAISKARNTYRDAVDEPDWAKLAHVQRAQRVPNDGNYRKLLFTRCVLEYHYLDREGDLITWHDVHPLLKSAPELRPYLQEVE
jgi:AAA ATPase domain